MSFFNLLVCSSQLVCHTRLGARACALVHSSMHSTSSFLTLSQALLIKCEALRTMAAASQPATLRSAQLQSLVSLLNFNSNVPSSSKPSTRPGSSSSSSAGGTFHQTDSELDVSSGPMTWKVLVLDKISQEILATSMRVQDLRDQGVTLHM